MNLLTFPRREPQTVVRRTRPPTFWSVWICFHSSISFFFAHFTYHDGGIQNVWKWRRARFEPLLRHTGFTDRSKHRHFFLIEIDSPWAAAGSSPCAHASRRVSAARLEFISRSCRRTEGAPFVWVALMRGKQTQAGSALLCGSWRCSVCIRSSSRAA